MGRHVIDEAVPAITRRETAMVTDAIESARNRAAVESGLRRLLLAQESASAEAP